MLFLFIILKPLIWLVFFKRIYAWPLQFLSKFFNFCMGFWLFSTLFCRFMLVFRIKFSKLQIEIIGLKFSKAFPFLLGVDTILIFFNLRENNCRWWDVHILRFKAFAFIFMVFVWVFMIKWGFDRLFVFKFGELAFLKTVRNFFIRWVIDGKTELTMRGFSFGLIKGRFWFEGFLVLGSWVIRTKIVMGLVSIDFFLLNHWISNLTLFIIKFEFCFSHLIINFSQYFIAIFNPYMHWFDKVSKYIQSSWINLKLSQFFFSVLILPNSSYKIRHKELPTLLKIFE